MPGKRRLTLVATAAVIALTPLTGALPAVAATAPSTPTTKDVLDVAPVDGAPTPATAGVVDGSTGALFVDTDTRSHYSWLDYSTGKATPVTLPESVQDGDVLPAGGDRVAVWGTGGFQLGDPATGVWTTVTLPTGTHPLAVSGSNVLVEGSAAGDYQLLAFDAQGATTAVPFQGIPAGATSLFMNGGQAAIGVGFITADGLTHWGLADWATGTYRELRAAKAGYPQAVQISGGNAVVFDQDPAAKSATEHRVFVYPVDQVLSGAAVTPRSPSTDIAYIRPVQVIGDHLLYFDFSNLTDVPLAGGPATVVSKDSSAWLFGNGEDLFTVPPQASQYSVQKYTLAADGSLTHQAVYTPPVPQSHLTGLWLRHGVLGYTRDWSAQTYTDSVVPGSDNVSVPAQPDLAPGWHLPAAGSGLPAGTLVLTLPWQPDRTVDTGAGCAPQDFQTSQHWLYWTCGANGPSGVYDLDANRNIPLPATAPGFALVGDGYLLTQDPGSGALLLTDFHTGTAAEPVTVGTARVVNDGRPGVSWTVDQSSGLLAFEGSSDRAIHVIDPGLPHSAVTGGPVGLMADPHSYTGIVDVSQPIDAWQAVVTRHSSGQVVARLSGGAIRAELDASWNTKLANGRFAYNGFYDMSVSVLPRGGAGYVPVASKEFQVQGGSVDRHVYNPDGYRPDLLTLSRSTGGADWWAAGSNGRIVSEPGGNCRPGGANLPLRTLIPIEHQAAYYSNDLLGIDASGALRWYENTGTDAFCPEHDLGTVIGRGWGIYNTVVSPGDLNGDGHEDLVARDTHGVLWFYAGRGRGQFAPRVRLGGGWNVYTRIVGAGDLTGSGYGSLLAVDGSGVLWRYDGNGHGGFHARVRLGGGWGQFNALVGIGDWNQNGTDDLLARDRSGRLWLYDGNGNGGFRGRVEIGTGFNRYWGLF